MSSESDSASSLYCAEDTADLVSTDADTWISLRHPRSSPSDESTVAGLFDSETLFVPEPDYLRRCRDRSIDVTARQDSINWILKVHAFHRFSPVTALLSVNYMDRFLSSHSLPVVQLNGWPFQLLSVACLSLAAKMEEPRVPLLLDLQMCESKYVFEPKTVARMELRVMSSLSWRLRSVTPFDFLHHFISNLPSSSSSSSATFGRDLLTRLFSASSDLILNTTRGRDRFFGFYAVDDSGGGCAMRRPGKLGESLWITPRTGAEMVRSCHQLMEEYLIDTCRASRHKDRRVEPVAPPSPVGVLDEAACGSCDTRSETPASGSQPEPPSKRLRSSAPDVQQQR
ncbi:Cyclin [Parasponia andersonii]|uniref:B-like cyclin n=1 Tax=Parasponia andersonii TaxID=3476 RepID=A0A2P5CXQ5_PARAD|nr:Cyclin [Parasponia andersonii]